MPWENMFGFLLVVFSSFCFIIGQQKQNQTSITADDNIIQEFYDQKLDHFNDFNNTTWLQV
jgi:hypothetical protein